MDIPSSRSTVKSISNDANKFSSALNETPLQYM